jgi:hypothetical protein
MPRARILALILTLALLAAAASAGTAPASPCAPYAFLIGQWDVAPEAGGAHKNLDVLIALDLEGGRIQEKGVLRVQPDGSLVREITASYSEGARPMGQPAAGPAGATARFRQTFKADGPDRVRTQVLRETKDGWVATFPGSDRLVMTRRKA